MHDIIANLPILRRQDSLFVRGQSIVIGPFIKGNNYDFRSGWAQSRHDARVR